MTLTAVLSWYEDISLDTLMNLRTSSCWVEDPEFFAHRQARAFQLVEYVEIHNWIEGPSFLPNPADDVEVEDASDDDSADQDEA